MNKYYERKFNESYEKMLNYTGHEFLSIYRDLDDIIKDFLYVKDSKFFAKITELLFIYDLYKKDENIRDIRVEDLLKAREIKPENNTLAIVGGFGIVILFAVILFLIGYMF